MTISGSFYSAVIRQWKALKKTSAQNLKDVFGSLFSDCKGAFRQSRTWERAFVLAEGLLGCVGRSTVTGIIAATGQQFKDWPAAYRLFQGKG